MRFLPPYPNANSVSTLVKMLTAAKTMMPKPKTSASTPKTVLLIVAIVATADGRSFQLRVLTTGDLFGERALLEHKPWPATYRVIERARLLRIDKAGLERSLAGNPDPRQLLDTLRGQRHDREVAAAAEKLLASPA